MAVWLLASVCHGFAQDLEVPTDSAEYRAALAAMPLKAEPKLHVSSLVPPSVQQRLALAYGQAVDRLRTAPECRHLFDDLELEAERALDFVLFYPASPLEEATVCRQHVAFARHGRGPIRLCRRFAALSAELATEVVLHEALHRAGLPECRTDPEAESPFEIQVRVVSACAQAEVGDPALLASGAGPQTLAGFDANPHR